MGYRLNNGPGSGALLGSMYARSTFDVERW